MKIVQIKYFCGIVENGGFLAASAELNVTQPALSRQIIELEKELDCQLLLRGPGGTKVTEMGQKFYLHARDILEKIDVARVGVHRKANIFEGEVSIALPVGMASQLAAPIVETVGKIHPDITICIEDGLGYQAGQSIDSGKVDFGILANVGHLQNVTFEPVLEEDLFFFTKREGTDPNTTDVDLIDLQDIPLAMPNRKVNVRRNLETAMIKLNGQLNIRYEQQSLLTIRSMVKAGIGATVLNWPSMSDLWFSGDIDARKIVNPRVSRMVCLAIPNSRPLSRAAAVVYDIVRKILVGEVEQGNCRGGQIRSGTTEHFPDR
jgi:LysR family nitrogen assimilation transcriptional regulator